MKIETQKSSIEILERAALQGVRKIEFETNDKEKIYTMKSKAKQLGYRVTESKGLFSSKIKLTFEK